MAMGCVGVSMDDFCRLTPAELEAVCGQWTSGQESLSKERWEQTRWVAYYSVVGFAAGKRLRPESVLSLPWDTKTTAKPSRRSTREDFDRERRLIEDLRKKHIL